MAQQRGKVNLGRACFIAAEPAAEVPKIDTFGQGATALAFDVLADIVLAGFNQAIAVFAFDVEAVGFSHGDVLVW